MSGIEKIAKEAEYYKSCRVQFMAEIADPVANTFTANSIRETTLFYIFQYIEKKFIKQQHSILVSKLNMHKNEFIVQRGVKEDALLYTFQNLGKKIYQRFGKRIVIKLANQQDGNFIYHFFVKNFSKKIMLMEGSSKMN